MTTMARPKRDFVLSTRAPYAPIVMLIGAVVVVGVVIRLLNASSPPPSPTHPLSGAPVGNGEAPVIITQAPTQAARGSLALLMPVDAAGEPLAMGPAFPAGASVALSVQLPTDQPTSVDVALSRMQKDGALLEAAPVSVGVVPDEQGTATVTTSVEQLTAELGAGIYRVELQWEGARIGGSDVALGVGQPTNVAIFDEPRSVLFAAGEHTGVRLDASGAVSEQKAARLPGESGAPASAFGLLNGRPHVFVTKGIWDGYWLPLGEGATLS